LIESRGSGESRLIRLKSDEAAFWCAQISFEGVLRMIDVAMRLDRSASGDNDHRAAASKKWK